MKDSREAILAMIAGEPKRPVVAPLWDGIFASTVLGKKYPSDSTFDEVLDVADICGFDPIIRLDFGLLFSTVDELRVQSRNEGNGDTRKRFTSFSCPAGTVEMVAHEPRNTSGTCVSDGSFNPRIYEVLEWYYGKILESSEVMARRAYELIDKYGSRGAVFIGTMSPFELNFLAYPHLIMLYMDNQERHHEVVELHMKVYELIVKTISKAGFDGLHTAGPPIELIGYNLYDQVAASYLKRVSEMVHEAGLLFTFHNCGHIRRLLKEGVYNEINLDMFETLAPPPMGELDDLRWARSKLSKSTCTRGNFDLEFLKTGAPSDITKYSREILEKTAGYRHIVGTADEILSGTPIENVRAMIEGAMEAG